MPELDDALEAALESSVPSLSVADLEAMGLGERQAIARYRAELEDVRYASAMRQLQRYTTRGTERRRPSARVLHQLARYVAALRWRRRGMRVELTANIYVVDPEYCRPRTIVVDIPPGDVGPIVDAWLRDDFDAAADAFVEALGANYVPELGICDEDEEPVEELEITYGPGA